MGTPTNDCWRRKTRVPALSHGVVCVILSLAVLIQYLRVTDGQTHDDGLYSRIASATRVRISQFLSTFEPHCSVVDIVGYSLLF